MDTLTHGLAGSMLARSASDRAGARAALATGLVAAMLPDLDILFLRTRLDYLRFHRGWTHSFVVLPVFALAVALVLRLVFRRARLPTLWLFAAIGIASHIVFDWITSFGTMFFFPISRTRYALDWVFILDPFFTGIPAATLIAAGFLRTRARAVTMAGSVVLALYVAFCAVLHARAMTAWWEFDQPDPGAKVAVLPQFLSPFRWLGLAEHEGSTHAAFFDIGPFARGSSDPRPPRRFAEVLQSLSDFYPPIGRATVRVFPPPESSADVAAARAMPDVEGYLQFARFPRATVRIAPDGTRFVFWEDLRFLPWFAGPWEVGEGGALHRRPFLFRVRLDGGGRPVDGAVVNTFKLP